jgi:hypothetical protein
MQLHTDPALCIPDEHASRWIKDSEDKAQPEDPRKAALSGQSRNST